LKLLAFLFLIIALFTGCEKELQAPQHKKTCSEVYDLKREQCDTLESLVTKLEPYSVVFIGDHHDSKNLHVKIANIIKSLQKRGFHIHLANEWFTPKDNKLLERYTQNIVDEASFLKAVKWKKKAAYTFDSFLPIYKAIEEGNGTLYGINLSKTERKMISEQNLSAMTPEFRSFYDELDLNVSAHRQLLAPFFEHCHRMKKGEDTLTCKERMYRVQVAWDSKMAQESVRLAKKVLKTPKDKLIIFAGAFHLTSHLGIDMRFSRESNLLHVSLLPYPKPQEPIDIGYSDFVIFYTKPSSAEE
jgi:uncharacterized iron-regulated protein